MALKLSLRVPDRVMARVPAARAALRQVRRSGLRVVALASRVKAVRLPIIVSSFLTP